MEGVPSTSKYNERENISSRSKYVESTTTDDRSKVMTKREERETFACCFCKLKEKYDYKGTQPPFQRNLIYHEECYIMRDPFTPLNQKETLILGGDCYLCKKPTCMDCSIFYTKRFCKICALDNIHDLPVQLHKKIKQFQQNNDNNDDENTST